MDAAAINWKLVMLLSLFGLAMAIGTVFVITPGVEPWAWLVIFLICALVIGGLHQNRPFLHGLLIGLVNSVWVTSAHIIFISQYLAIHPREARMMESRHASSPRLMMALFGPIVGLVSGVILGLLAVIASILLGRRRLHKAD